MINGERNGYVLEATGLAKEVSSPDGALTILQGIDLRIASGESVAIVGESGAGKSTLLALLAGLDLPTSGDVRLAGQSLSALDEDGRAELRARRVGFIFQSFHLIQSLNAIENVLLPLELMGDAAAAEHAREVMDSVGLSHRLHHYPRQLSGGERQRVAIARAFVARPALLFADEPTGNLDAATGERIAELLFSLNAGAGTTLLLVTHDRTLAARCERLLELEAGRLV